MELSIAGLPEIAQAGAGIALPEFDVEQMQRAGREVPRWIHFGAGNLFRIFLARIAHDLVAGGHMWPVAAVQTTSPDGLDKQIGAHDLMTLGVILNPDGSRDLSVIAGVSEGLATDREADYQRLREIAVAPSVSLVTFTITEKGYVIADSHGELTSAVRDAIAAGPKAVQTHTMAMVAALLFDRFEAGGAPITLISTDNFSHNGDKLRDSVLTIARGWVEAGLASEDYLHWLEDDTKVAFPISVIDKITPRPNEQVATELAQLGFTDMALDTTSRTPLAGFVNAEPTEYLIIEDKFAGERPPLEDAGVNIVERQVCDDFENMKVTTCLNPLHTALAVSGCLLRFPTIDSEMRDPALAALVNELGWKEGLPVVVDPGIVAPEDFLREVLEVRFPNRYLPDDPARIAMDTSQKVPIRYGETIKKYVARGKDLSELHAMPLVFAIWCRYLMGVADDGEPFTPSSDPLLEELQPLVAGLPLDGSATSEQIHEALAPILSNTEIFRTDLYTTPLGEKAEEFFAQLIAAPGAVRATLDKEYTK